VDSPQPAPAGATGLFHVGLTVVDLEHSVRFYTEAIGLAREWHQCIDRESTRTLVGVPFVKLHCEFLAIPGGGMLELLRYEGVGGEPVRSVPNDPGTAHLCLWVRGLDEVLARARELGGRSVAADPVVVPDGRYTGARVVYLRDPDDFLIELIELPGSGD
jgi:catechol 2,3-dioxygenase-like lactoylglutathione lyase family enzyme